MKKLILSGIFCLAVLLLIFAGGCMKDTQMEKRKGEELDLFVVSDLHYLSSTLYDPDSEIFHRLMDTNDGKIATYGKEQLACLKETVLETRPDALLVCGDLTFNGEKVSLEEVREVLREIEKEGTDVLVIPGNHDISYRYAASYFDSAQPVPNIPHEQFVDMMKEFGYEEAISKDEETFSYMYELNEHVCLLAIDTNLDSQKGTIPENTLAWMEKELSAAGKAGYTVIVMSHQNVLIQSQMMYIGYVMNNHEEAEELLKKYGVTLVLSGHSHLQHTAVSDTLTDICTGSMSVAPLGFGLVHVDEEGNWTYGKHTFGILQEEAQQEFDNTVIRMIKDTIQDESIPEEYRDDMRSFAIRMNRMYFAGELCEPSVIENDPAWQLWQTYAKDTFWGRYMADIYREAKLQHN